MHTLVVLLVKTVGAEKNVKSRIAEVPWYFLAVENSLEE